MTLSPLRTKRILALILALFLLLGITYALTTPVFEASDELWHYPMIRHLADGNPLPVQVFEPAQAGPWKQEASQPPLYYYVGAALTFWIDTSDMAEVRDLNPHVDNGVITPDDNINLVVHDPALSPWQGTLLAVRIVRLASVIMGAATVYLTYQIASEVSPQRPELALGAAAANAFLPMFLFISGAVNNDNLAIPLSSLALLLMIRAVRRQQSQQFSGARWGRWVILGIVIGLAVLTKEGTLGLLPLAWGTGLVVAWQMERCRQDEGAAARAPELIPWAGWGRVLGRSLLTSALVMVPVLLIAGWWYYRNIVLYGDWLGWSAFIAVLGQRAQPATLAQLWGERWGFMASYWGLFGGVNVPMASWIYDVLNGLLLLAVPGFLIYAIGRVRHWWRHERSRTMQRRRLSAGRILGQFFQFLEDHFALVVCLLFSAAVVLGLIRWATTTWSSQGRLVFTAISTLSVLLVLGLAGWMPRRAALIVTSAFGGFLFLLAALAPFLWIGPAYEVSMDAPPAELEEVNIAFGERMRLVGYRLQGRTTVRPGDTVELVLAWEALQEMERDWSVFVHLNDPVLQTPLAQRDMYPGGGLMSTRFLEPGQEVVDRYMLTIPSTAVTPSELELVIGLYDYERGVRLMTGDGRDAARLTTLQLEALAGEYPNSTRVNFDNQLELVGFSVEPRRVAPGEVVELVVYWQALQPLEQDYTFFAQVLEAESVSTTRWASQDIHQATSDWAPETVETVRMPLQLQEDTPPGIYDIIVGAYAMDEQGNIRNLQIVRDDRITMDRFLNLTRIRVEDRGSQ